MNVHIEKLIGNDIMRTAINFVYGYEKPISTKDIYSCAHTPMRLHMFAIFLEGIKTKVSVHLVRHSQVGQFHLVKSNRADWANAVDVLAHDSAVTRDTPVHHFMMLNSEHIIQISHKRLCGCAEDDTRELWCKVKHEMYSVDYHLYKHMVPQCVYRNGICAEKKPGCTVWAKYEKPWDGERLKRVTKI